MAPDGELRESLSKPNSCEDASRKLFLEILGKKKRSIFRDETRWVFSEARRENLDA